MVNGRSLQLRLPPSARLKPRRVSSRPLLRTGGDCVRLIVIVLMGLILAAPARAGESARFTAMDQTAIRMYFAANPIVWMGLPGDVARQFVRGKPLPRAATAVALPRALLAKLPSRQGYDYVRVGDDVALVERATRLVVDVIEDIFG